MTDLRKAAEMALEALERYAFTEGIAIQALRQALAPTKLPRPDEPIWVVDEKGNKQLLAKQNRAPPKREWVGLTDAQVEEIAEYHGIDCLYETSRIDFYRAIEAKLKEKNT